MAAEERKTIITGTFVADEETVRRAEDIKRKRASGEEVPMGHEEFRDYIDSGA